MPEHEALISVFRQWFATPYMVGQRSPGQGVDCAQLIFGMMDTLHGRETPTDCPKMIVANTVHNARVAFRCVILMRRAYPTEIVRDGSIEPGDIILTRGLVGSHGPRRPGHAVIAGIVPGTCFHAVPLVGVCMSSLTSLPGVLRVYRPLEKHRWAS